MLDAQCLRELVGISELVDFSGKHRCPVVPLTSKFSIEYLSDNSGIFHHFVKLEIDQPFPQVGKQ